MILNERGERVYATDLVSRQLAKARRDRLRELGLCINGAGHGPATHGSRCKHCHDVRNGLAEPLPPVTHCKRGHEFTTENTIVRPCKTRACRTCRRMRNAANRKGIDVRSRQE